MNIDVETRWTERLPPEVWQIVLHFTSSETIRDCLGVSRLFHDIAARKIFSSLRIRFGSWEVAYELTDKPPEDNECRTCCVLLRILTDPVFASYVKHLDILAFADKLAPFEMCSLTKAIGAMYNLRTFRWHTVSGTFTMPSNELLGTLASTCGRLRGCSLPFSIQCLDALRSLKRLPVTNFSMELVHPDTPGAEFESLDAYRTSLASLFEAYQGSLTWLSAPSQVIWGCPVYIMQGLTHLSIHHVEHLSNITLLFRHCIRLESLDIQYPDEPPTTLFAALAANPAALPHLTHLKIRLHPGINQSGLDALAAFIRSKKNLRCLDFSDRGSTIPELASMLSAIESSSGLEVLGIDVYFDTLGLNDLAILRRTIPKTVTALRLRLLYSPFDMDEPPEENIPWIELWAGLPRLAFAHVEDNEADPTVWYDDLAEAVKSLKLLARRASFHEVERIDGNFTLGDSWSHTKVQFRTVEDFGCEDWEWLMRGHVLLDDLDY